MFRGAVLVCFSEYGPRVIGGGHTICTNKTDLSGLTCLFSVLTSL